MTRSPGTQIPFEYRFLHKSGHYIWLEGLVSNQLENPSAKGVIANYRDITSRKGSEAVLALTLSRFEQAQKVTRMGYWHFDLATGKPEWPKGNYRGYGLQSGCVTPQKISL